jgi:stress response protein YsnF
MSQTITALYDNTADAQDALNKLVAAGIPKPSIRLVEGRQTSATQTTGAYDHTRDEGGFWSSLKDLFLPEEDRYSYSEGLNRGGTMLTVTAEDSNIRTVADVLEQTKAVNLDERESSWRQSGWNGYTGSSASATGAEAAGGIPATGASAGTIGLHASGSSGTPGLQASGTAGAASAGDARTGNDQTIPIVEERLNVGKRVTEQGRVRLRSYAIETPVNEQVSLREESVHVDRHKVDRPVTAADEALFAEKTIEATERVEEAVVSKDARVVEEVGLRKNATQHTETVTDKVRRTEVEVEDERGNITRTGTGGTTERR